MSSSTNINIRVDSDVKNRAGEIYSSLGFDMTSAINIFLRQVIRTNSIPFELVAEPITKTPKLGCMECQMREENNNEWFEPIESVEESKN